MIIGTRVLYPEEVDYWNAEVLQISVYKDMKGNLEFMRKCVDACRNAGKKYVIHPVKYSLMEEETLGDLREMAELTDRALILHDERTPDGNRLDGTYSTRFLNALDELKSVTEISIENASHTGDVRWFWDTFADSVTLDIGHIESFGLDSEDFVRSLDESIMKKIQFVHIHRNNGMHGGITDHWPLTTDCRELRALRELVTLKPDVSVILEINEVEEIDHSLEILSSMKSSLPA